ncbi:inactive non-canonical poly(a) RNA polymerase protein trf4-2-related [Anaeramoeba flamelloides]|uniref:Inactive non-canonical poly(A) RNA polymerase protein trf4-2-related n=1 Tax=Anaeramoeba flamelloides TaxID=1746091 RepID=A0ABQ8Z6X7_9EUKA|nr:inactive non-canonical poly(a) RNA polymerase protein trf4-2-related [Anaeramoeba flamelloides]
MSQKNNKNKNKNKTIKEIEKKPTDPVSDFVDEQTFFTILEHYQNLDSQVTKTKLIEKMKTFQLKKNQPQYMWEPKYSYEHENKFLKLHSEILEFQNYIQPTEETRKMRNAILAKVEKAIKKLWITAKVNVYGSFTTDSYLPDSDLDIFVDSKILKPDSQLASDLGKHLSKKIFREDFEDLQIVKNARFPLVRFYDKPTHIHIDITFNRKNTQTNVLLYRRLLASYPPLKPLLFVMKTFLKAKMLNEPYRGGIGSYCTMLMIVSLIQRIPLSYEEKKMENLGKLLVAFFQVYSKFDYENVGISICGEGCYFSKKALNVYDEESPLTFYFHDPIGFEDNLTRACFAITELKTVFSEAFHLLIKGNSLQSIFLKTYEYAFNFRKKREIVKKKK